MAAVNLAKKKTAMRLVHMDICTPGSALTLSPALLSVYARAINLHVTPKKGSIQNTNTIEDAFDFQ